MTALATYARLRAERKLRILRERAADETLSYEERVQAAAEADAFAAWTEVTA